MTVDKYRPRCFLDIEIDEETVGRIIVELFSDICPVTCENFRALCTGEKGIGKTTQKPLHYKGAPFHRVVKNFVIQGGDFVAGNGTGGESIYGGQFKDENFDIPHDKPFLLSMSNRGKDSNGSQFFITTQPAPHLNGKHTVFGQVISGEEVVLEIEKIKTDQSCRPIKDVKINNCGELVLKIKQREKRPKSVESSASEDESDGRKSKKKKREKHKKHKKERKEAKSSNTSRKDPEDTGCMVDPEEIPEVPANNFLLRRTSPLGDSNRRPNQRETYNYQRPSRSRSGRKIKGRGFMRYRTPSRSASRSGSETPPHWKQAQSRLRSIKDVVPKPTTPDHSESEDIEDEAPKIMPLQSRLGIFAKNDDQKQKDARMTLQNRRNKNKSPDSSPRRESGRSYARKERESSDPEFSSSHFQARTEKDQSRNSPLRSKVVVKSGFLKESEERSNERSNYGNSSRNRTDLFSNFNSRDRDSKQERYSQRNRSPVRIPSQQNKKNIPKANEKSIIDAQKRKQLNSLANELCRYTRGSDSNSGNNIKREEKKKLNVRKFDVDSENQKKRLKSLENDLFRYVKEDIASSEKKALKPPPKKITRKKAVQSQNKALASNSSADSLQQQKCSSVTSDLSSHDKEGAKEKPKNDETGNTASKIDGHELQSCFSINSGKSIAEVHYETSNIDDLSNISNASGVQNSNEIASNLSENLSTKDGKYEKNKIHDSIENSANDSSKDVSPDLTRLGSQNEIDQEVKLQSSDSPLNVEKQPKERRRWDVQSPQVIPKSVDTHSDTLQITESVFSSSAFDEGLAEVIPLPEETEPPKSVSVTKAKLEPLEVDDSSNQNENENTSHDKRKYMREHEDPDTQKTEETSQTQKITLEKSRSSSVNSKESSKSPAKHSPARKMSTSPDRKFHSKRAKSPVVHHSKSPSPRKLRSPTLRRQKQDRRSKSRSRSRSHHKSLSPSRNRARRRYSRSPDARVRRSRSRTRDERTQRRRIGGVGRTVRSPERRAAHQRRYSKSPSYRGRTRVGGRARRTRSRSPLQRRRRGHRSSSSSGSSSSRNSSSSSGSRKKRSARRGKKGKRRSSSSSSSSSSASKKSGSVST